MENKKKETMENKKEEASEHRHSGCPGSRMMNLKNMNSNDKPAINTDNEESQVREPNLSMLRQWPVQLQLVPYNAPYFNGADLLVAADCTAYAFGDFHSFMKDKITLIGCPKLDDADYSEKLTQILKHNSIKSITVIRMEVPCCGGIVHAVKTAIMNSGELIPWRMVVLSTDGRILEDTK